MNTKDKELRSAFENFVDNVWPQVLERFDLPEDTEPTQEEFEIWDGAQIDAADYYCD